MHRSSNSARVSDEFFSNSSSSSAAAAAAAGGAMSSPNPKPAPLAPDLDHLPIYDPISHVAKKEKNRFRSAENAVHLIPFLLLLCAFILWVFSSPVELVNKSDSVVAGVESSLINRGIDDHGHGNSSLESNLEQEEVDPVKQSTEDVDTLNQPIEDEDLVNHLTDSAEHNTIR